MVAMAVAFAVVMAVAVVVVVGRRLVNISEITTTIVEMIRAIIATEDFVVVAMVVGDQDEEVVMSCHHQGSRSWSPSTWQRKWRARKCPLTGIWDLTVRRTCR